MLGPSRHGTVGADGLFVRRHQHWLVGWQEEIFVELGETVVTVRSTVRKANRLGRRHKHRTLTVKQYKCQEYQSFYGKNALSY